MDQAVPRLRGSSELVDQEVQGLKPEIFRAPITTMLKSSASVRSSSIQHQLLLQQSVQSQTHAASNETLNKPASFPYQNKEPAWRGNGTKFKGLNESGSRAAPQEMSSVKKQALQQAVVNFKHKQGALKNKDLAYDKVSFQLQLTNKLNRGKQSMNH